MITCIATDMDGTLLNEDRIISEENKRALLAAREAGIDIVIATGRSPEYALYPLKEAGIRLPIICMNGAQIYSEKMELIASLPLDTNTIESIYRVLTEEKIYFEFYTQKGQYSLNKDLAITTLKEIMAEESGSLRSGHDILQLVKERFEKGKITFLNGFDELLQDTDLKIYKIIAFSTDAEKLEGTREKLSTIKEISVTSSGHDNIEITRIDAQKGLALERYVRIKGLSMENTMAIGDSFNDFSMLERAGFPVAMGNAHEDIKKIARFVTDTNGNDGFAKAVYEVLKRNDNER